MKKKKNGKNEKKKKESKELAQCLSDDFEEKQEKDG